MTENGRNGHGISTGGGSRFGTSKQPSGTETHRTMGKKGRHGRSKNRGAAALVARVSEQPVVSVPPPAADADFDANHAPVKAETLPVTTETVPVVAEAAPAAAVVAPTVEGPSEPVVVAVVEAPEYVPPPSRPRIETPVAFAASPELAQDDSSVPAVDLDSAFFAESAPALPHAHEVHEPEERDPRMALKMTPEAASRRAQFQKYVRFAVGAASALCLAALVKVAVARNHEEPAVPRAAAAMQVAPPPVAPKAAETALPVEAVPPPADPPVAEPAPAEEPATATATTTEPATAQADPAADTAAPEPDPKAAAKAKHDSQLALERGKVADAIEAGEQSVSLDPSDAEAWLILGAAYQEKGDIKNARRSFRSCLDQGKRGPKWECAQMPH